ncbi:MAG: methyltransferase domain-containing protein [Azospirillaceae bacterium]
MAWDPAQYGRFAGPRLQPGLDLIARLPDAVPGPVVDLGCGDGDLTALLAARFGRAEGIDSDPAMLAAARQRHPALAFAPMAIEDWVAAASGDHGLVFSNAALHWVEGHERLFPALLERLAPGGTLAVQMPRSMVLPSHRLLAEIAAEPEWDGRAGIRTDWVWDPERYHDLLAPLTARLEIWETEYLHVLTGADAVFEWVKGSALTAVRAALDDAAFRRFCARYRESLRALYPRRADGRTLYPFRRLFLLACG